LDGFNLKPRGRREHARVVATLHHSQVAEDVGDAAPVHTGSLRPQESPMRHFTNEGHSAVADAAQGDEEISVARTDLVPEVFMHFCPVPAPGGATGLPGGAMHVAAFSVDA
jgi:PAB1-binding protein PBP1